MGLINLITLGALLATQGIANATNKNEVVVYTSVDDVFARPIAELFQKKTGIEVKLVTDTEETKSTGILNRLIAEKTRPQADVFWSGDPIRAAILKSKGVSAPYLSPEAKTIPKEYRDSQGYWIGFSARARVLLINTDKMTKDTEPNSVYDLANPKFSGLGCIANPLFGTTSMHAAAIFSTLGDEKAKAFFEGLLKNKVKVLSSNGEVRRQVSNGNCGFGVVDTDDAFEAIHDKKPVKAIFADEKGLGSLLVPNAAVLIKDAPHIGNAKKFIDFILSSEVEKKLAESDAAQIPLRSNVPVPELTRNMLIETPVML